ncbi:MAG: site-2 protease family protein [Planctomycetota bacterium]
MIQEPPRSNYDLNFELLGYQIRVFWGFWILAAILGWSWSEYMHAYSQVVTESSPGPFVFLLIWVAAVFLSILVHELGHSLAFSYFGIRSHIVLHHMGGVAIANSFGSWDGARQGRLGSRENVIVSAAGPALQLALAAVTLAIAYAFNISATIPFTRIPLSDAANPQPFLAFAFVQAIVLPSVFWALLNLAPVFPMDGGQILRGLLEIFNVRDPHHATHLTSLIVAALLGVYFLSVGQLMPAMLFMFLGATNYQMMQMGRSGF